MATISHVIEPYTHGKAWYKKAYDLVAKILNVFVANQMFTHNLRKVPPPSSHPSPPPVAVYPVWCGDAFGETNRVLCCVLR